MAYQSFYLSIFLSFQQFFHLISLASISATVFKLCTHNEDNQVHYYKQNQGAEMYFCLLFLIFFIFSISQSTVMNMIIFVKDFSGTALPRILKFGTSIRYDKLYYVYKIQPHIAYQSLYLSIFLSFQLIWYGLRWLPPGVCELCSLFAIFCLLLFTCNNMVSVGEASSSSWCLGWATLFYCGTP